jgi:hypothetical protein
MIRSPKIYCPLRCGMSSYEKMEIRLHLKSFCPKLNLIKNEFDFCEKDFLVMVKIKAKKDHCEDCAKLYEKGSKRKEVNRNKNIPYFLEEKF